MSLFGARSFRVPSIARRQFISGSPTRRALAAVPGAALLASAGLAAVRSNGSAAGLPPVGWSKGSALPASFVTRWDAAYGYLPDADKVVLFGGSPKTTSETWRADSWIYSNGTWSEGPAAPAGLTRRGGAAMAYDPEIGKLVLFGGGDGSWPPTLNDTWLFDGAAWTPGPAAPSGLTPRAGAQMVYDPDIRKVVLFGGSGLRGFAETWLFDGSAWAPGPAAPAGMAPRSFFAMAYDPVLHKVLVAGGDGATDTWYYDGTSWAPGPDMGAVGFKERVRMDYDPDLGGMVLFGGIGPSAGSDRLWLLRGGVWTRIMPLAAKPWPAARVDAPVLWHPKKDALMVFAGIKDSGDGSAGHTDTWFFRDVPPAVSSVTLSPTAPTEDQTITLTTGPVQGGYGKVTYAYSWYVNGVLVPSATGKFLSPGNYGVGDSVQAKVQLTDQIGLTGAVVAATPVTVADRAPTLGSAWITPKPGYVSSTLTANSAGVADPDGDAVTLHYSWTVNGAPTGGDSPTLTPDRFTAGDSIGVTVTATDQWGMSSPSITTSDNILWNLTAGNPHPGGMVSVSGSGFGPSEQVDVRLDAATGLLLGTATADATGHFNSTSFSFPSPEPGGPHTLYGVGRTSGIVGPGPVTVVPIASVAPHDFPAGGTTVLTGLGFVPGETVSAWFPVGATVQQAADTTGSVVMTLVSPPEPYPGGVITVSAPSATTTTGYGVQAKLTLPSQGTPNGQASVSVTGFGASESVQVQYDGGPVAQTFSTDSFGSGTATITLPGTFGKHTVKLTGTTSGVTQTGTITLAATMTIAPTSGKVGTVITVDSGPGWIPGQTVHLWWGWNNPVKDVVADASGKVHTTYTVPPTAPTTVKVWLVDDVLAQQISASFTVVP